MRRHTKQITCRILCSRVRLPRILVFSLCGHAYVIELLTNAELVDGDAMFNHSCVHLTVTRVPKY